MSRYKSAAGEAAVMQAYDAIMADWTIPYESRMVESSAGKTHVILAGNESAPPLLLVHGAFGNAAFWAYVAPDFTKTHRIIAVDVIGQPTRSADSPYPAKPDYNAAWLLSVMYALNLQKAAILGLSYGGWQTLNFYFHHPERFEKMILLSSLSIVFVNLLPIMLEGVKAAARGERGYREMSEFVGISKEYPKGQEFFTQCGLHAEFNPFLPTTYNDAMLKQIQCPLLAIYGTADKLIDGKKATARLKRVLPHAEVHLIPNATHLLPLSEKAVVMPIIQGFLKA